MLIERKEMSAKNSRRKFLCLDCRVDTGKINEHYMLVDATWNRIHNSKYGMLCIACVENRLVRTLEATDFNQSHINNPRLYPMSLRLIDRLARKALVHN
jgi:hypothetical protein